MRFPGDGPVGRGSRAVAVCLFVCLFVVCLLFGRLDGLVRPQGQKPLLKNTSKVEAGLPAFSFLRFFNIANSGIGIDAQPKKPKAERRNKTSEL